MQTTLRTTVLSRVEDAGLNASAPPQQRWLDGWLVRFSPGKAKRARCVNAVAQGRLSIQEKFALCQQVFAEAQLPLIFRITPMSEPQTLDSWLDGHATSLRTTRRRTRIRRLCRNSCFLVCLSVRRRRQPWL